MNSEFYHVCPDSHNNPPPFISMDKKYWNDVLNNYRTPLGGYEYRRMLFAKNFLYTDSEFNDMYKFVIVRNPYDRIISAWKYLFRKKVYDPRLFRMKYNLHYFLDRLPHYWEIKYEQFMHNRYIGLHTAAIWPDITDDDGHLLIDNIYKIENTSEWIQSLSDNIGVQKINLSRKNKSIRSPDYKKYYNSKTQKIVERYYEQDLEKLNYNF